MIAVACIAGWWVIVTLPLDATPDLSNTQVIIYSHWDRSPDIIEDQVTYPIVTDMLGAPHVKTVWGYSDFGYSYLYVIFADGTDLYWAGTRVLEYLSSILPRLPDGVKTDALSVMGRRPQDLPQFLTPATDKRRRVSDLSFLKSGRGRNPWEKGFRQKILTYRGDVPDTT